MEKIQIQKSFMSLGSVVVSQYPGRCICINTVTGNQCTYLLKVRIVYPEVNSINAEAIRSI